MAGRRGGQPVWTVIISGDNKTKSRRGWEECDDYQEKSCKNKDVSGNGNKDGWNGGDKRSKSREGEHVGHRHCCKSKHTIQAVQRIKSEGQTQERDSNLCDIKAK